ncbi:MAG: FAD binding domain-containing protein [Stappiaceae bacterium]
MVRVETFANIAEAAGAMNQETRFLAGGTLVMEAVNYGSQRFNRIVRTRDPAMKSISLDSSRIVIGAGVTMADILRNPELSFLAPAARAVGGPAIRNMATVGGNLFAPNPYGDFATALLALDADVRFTDGSETPIESFFSNRHSSRGLVAAVIVNRRPDIELRFKKVSRVKPKGIAVMSIAVALNRQVGRLSNTRIAFGAMGPTALRAKAAEAALESATLDAAGVASALNRTMEGLAPQDDPIASAWYRASVAPVHLRRLLLGEESFR